MEVMELRKIITICLTKEIVEHLKTQPRSFNFSKFINQRYKEEFMQHEEAH